MNGAAVVAVIVNAFSFIFIVGYVQTRDETRQYELFVRFWRPDWHALWEVLRLGLPISITILAEVTLFAAASILMGQIGTVELAAHGIALQLASIAFMIPLGLSQAATVRVGIARGQRDYTALVRAAVTVYVIACAIALCGGILFAMAPQFLAQWFLDAKLPEAPEVLAYASGLVVIAGVFQLVDGIQAVAAGLLGTEGCPYSGNAGTGFLLANRAGAGLDHSLSIQARRARHLVRLSDRPIDRRHSADDPFCHSGKA